MRKPLPPPRRVCVEVGTGLGTVTLAVPIELAEVLADQLVMMASNLREQVREARQAHRHAERTRAVRS